MSIRGRHQLVIARRGSDIESRVRTRSQGVLRNIDLSIWRSMSRNMMFCFFANGDECSTLISRGGVCLRRRARGKGLCAKT